MIKKFDYKLINEEETIRLGKKIGEQLFPGAIITLEGSLGAGKTTFTKGIAQGLDISDIVKSPTFTIIREYAGRLNLYHIDAYRLESSEEDLGLDDYLFSDGVTVIEWASRISDQLPEEHLHITLYDMGNSERIIEMYPKSTRYETICEAVLHD